MEENDPKKGKVTDEHRAEAAKLKAIWDASKPARAALGLGSQEAFGAEYGIGNQAAMTFFLNGKTALSLKAAVGFARGLGVQVSDFSPRLAKQLFEEPAPAGAGDEDGPPVDFNAIMRWGTPEERAAYVEMVRQVVLKHRVKLGPQKTFDALDALDSLHRGGTGQGKTAS